MAKTNINHQLKAAKQVMFIGHMGHCYREVKSRTLSGIMEEIGGFTKKARRDFSKIDTHGTRSFYNYKSALYEFTIEIIF